MRGKLPFTPRRSPSVSGQDKPEFGNLPGLFIDKREKEHL